MLGFPAEHRVKEWAKLLGLSGVDAKCRFWRYSEITRPPSELRVIEQDVIRTRQDDEHFRTLSTINKMKRSLISYCSFYNCEYMQGLNEIMAVMISIIPFQNDFLSIDDCELPEICLAIFERFVEILMPVIFSTKGVIALQMQLMYFNQLFCYHAPELWCYLETEGMTIDIYATAWFVTIFSRRSPIHVVLHLWDLILITRRPHIIIFIGIAFMTWNEKLIRSLKKELIPETLVRLNFQTNADVDEVFHLALRFECNTPQSIIDTIIRMGFDSSLPQSVRLQAFESLQSQRCPCALVAADDIATVIMRPPQTDSSDKKHRDSLVSVTDLLLPSIPSPTSNTTTTTSTSTATSAVSRNLPAQQYQKVPKTIKTISTNNISQMTITDLIQTSSCALFDPNPDTITAIANTIQSYTNSLNQSRTGAHSSGPNGVMDLTIRNSSFRYLLIDCRLDDHRKYFVEGSVAVSSQRAAELFTAIQELEAQAYYSNKTLLQLVVNRLSTKTSALLALLWSCIAPDVHFAILEEHCSPPFESDASSSSTSNPQRPDTLSSSSSPLSPPQSTMNTTFPPDRMKPKRAPTMPGWMLAAALIHLGFARVGVVRGESLSVAPPSLPSELSDIAAGLRSSTDGCAAMAFRLWQRGAAVSPLGVVQSPQDPVLAHYARKFTLKTMHSDHIKNGDVPPSSSHNNKKMRSMTSQHQHTVNPSSVPSSASASAVKSRGCPKGVDPHAMLSRGGVGVSFAESPLLPHLQHSLVTIAGGLSESLEDPSYYLLKKLNLVSLGSERGSKEKDPSELAKRAQLHSRSQSIDSGKGFVGQLRQGTVLLATVTDEIAILHQRCLTFRSKIDQLEKLSTALIKDIQYIVS